MDQDTWQGESFVLPQNSASLPLSGTLHFYSELSGRAAISDSELLSLEGITLHSPQIDAHSHSSLPCSPISGAAALPRKKRIVECLSKTLKTATSGLEKALRSPIRKSSSSPKLTRAQKTSELWGQQLDALKFSFDFEETPDNPLSPLQTAEILQTPESTVKTEQERPNGANSFHNYEASLSAPIQDPEDSRIISSQRHPSDDMHFPPTPNMELGPHQWSQAPHVSKTNGYPTPLMYGDEAPLWWNHASTAPMAQPSPTALHINPQRATRSLANQLQNDISYRANKQAYIPPNMGTNGLIIQMPGMPGNSAHQAFFRPRQSQGLFTPNHPQFNGRPRQGSSRHQIQSHSTNKSRTKSSDSESPSPKSSPAYHVRKRRITKNKNSTPRTPTLGAAIDFVNFTPNDSRKILTGVAPSGSSKTKARREKEAMEKRRKLSQAAVRAVREAGGDVDSLVEQGLLV